MDEELTRDAPPDRKFAATVTSPGQCKRVLSIEIPEEEVEREREALTRRLRREIKVPGFRKGKVPVGFIRKNYADVIQNDAVRNLLPQVYEEAIRREGIEPLGEPHFENVSAEVGQGVRAEASVEVRPEIEVTGYKEMTVHADKRSIGDADVDATLEHLRDRLATYQPVDRPASATDYVVIDYAPYLESGAIDESSRQKNYPVELSSESLLGEFREGLVGKRAGDETEIEVAYPEDFGDAKLAGTRRRFQVRVDEVKEKLVAELDDAFAKRLNPEVETMAELRERIRKDLEHEEEHRLQHEVEERIIDGLIERNSFEVPETMVENYLASVLEEDRRRRPHVEDEAARVKEIRETFRDAAMRGIRKYFIMDAIKKQEGLTLDDEEIETHIRKLAVDSERSEEEIQDYFRHPQRRRSLEDDLLDRKVMELLRAHTRVE